MGITAKDGLIGGFLLFIALILYLFSKSKQSHEGEKFVSKLLKEQKERQKNRKITCSRCGKDVEFFTAIKYGGYKDSDGKTNYYCEDCGKKRNKITEIMYNLGLFQGGNLDFFGVNKNKQTSFELSFEEIMDKLEGKEITEKVIGDIVELEKEKAKIREREKKAKLREKAEKEYYGKPKTKREPLEDSVEEAVYSKYNNSCAICGATEGLHIHHKDNDPKNNKINNLILLCGICHKKIHMKVR